MTDEEFDVLCIAIAKLSPQRRKVLVLRFFYEYSTREISDSLNMPLRTVHHDLARALEAVHAARAASEVVHDSIFARVMARHRRRRRDT